MAMNEPWQKITIQISMDGDRPTRTFIAHDRLGTRRILIARPSEHLPLPTVDKVASASRLPPLGP